MLTQQEINDFLQKYNYDVRISGNARWIDQKCAADVVTAIADCIYNYELEHPNRIFTTPDIWHYEYAVENIEAVFKKPGVESAAAKNEYDKFFQQPMEMLSYARVLTKTKKGNRNFYQVNSMEVLEYIALREKNALYFLKTYIQKVLEDSGIYSYFQLFYMNQTKNTYHDVKKAFSDFTIAYTKIKGEVECNRIFIKVLNPLSYFNNAKGTEKGRLSEQIITYDMLMYNRNNFRDVFADKPKGTARKVYAMTHPVEVNDAYYRYQSSKAKRFLRIFNEQQRYAQTEHLDGIHINDKATHIHHIFPEAEFPEICFYIENLIALTPTQHLNYAHPNGRTQEIAEQYQHLLLISKADRIRENLTTDGAERIYDFYSFLFVLNVGFDDDSILEIDSMNFGQVVRAIHLHYADIREYS